jgi:outer membrane lipoprotein-sorting protein
MVVSTDEVKKGFFVQSARLIFAAAIYFIIGGCLMARPPGEMKFTSNASIDSLSSNASVKFKSTARSISGGGYIMFKKPDQIRLVIQSPFGSVLQEIFVSGDQVTIVDTGNGIAFIGAKRDLPETGDFSSWRFIQWIIDIYPPDLSRGNAIIDGINMFGQQEKATFEKGLLISKCTDEGGIVRYGKYSTVQGVALPFEIRYETAAKELFTIELEDPDVNIPIAEDSFRPNLSKYHQYPLSSLK